MRIFPVFFARVSPASQSANPACIKNTRIAAIRTQITSVAEYIISPPFIFRVQKRCIPGIIFIPLMHLVVSEGIFMIKGKALRKFIQSAFAFMPKTLLFLFSVVKQMLRFC